MEVIKCTNISKNDECNMPLLNVVDLKVDLSKEKNHVDYTWNRFEFNGKSRNVFKEFKQ